MTVTGATVIYYTETNAERQLETAVNTTNIDELEKQIHELVNAERVKYGLTALRFNPELVGIARAYSQEMAKNNFLAHEDPQGKKFSDRYKDAGFTCAIRHDPYEYEGAENLYGMHLGKKLSPFGSVAEYFTHDEIPHEVVNGWMNSHGHRQNILTEFWQSEGIGVAVAKDGKVYVTQNFC